jgi:SAM-dependent methyltransferase
MTDSFIEYAQFYDLVYRDKDYQREALYIANILKKHGLDYGNVLDIGAGTGRHAIELARMGFNVLGIDSSSAMIDRASEALPAELSGQVSFSHADARSFRCPQRFDAAIALFHVMSYQITSDDLMAVFATAAQHLKNRGVFVFDAWHGPAVLARRPEVRMKSIGDEHIDVVRIAEPTLDESKNVVSVNYRVTVANHISGQELASFSEVHCLRYLFTQEVESMLKLAGFELLDAHEWETFSPLSIDTWSASYIARRL